MVAAREMNTDICRDSAKRFNGRAEFNHRDHVAWKYAKKNGLLDELFPNVKHCRMCGEILPFNNQSGLCPGFCYEYHQELRSEYRVAARRGIIYDRNCLCCGARILTAFKNKIYCDDACKQNARSQSRLETRGVTKTDNGLYKIVCSECGNTFETDSRTCRICPQCKKDAEKRRNKQWRDNNPEHIKEYRESHQDIYNERQKAARKANPGYFNELARRSHKKKRDEKKQQKIIETQELLFSTVKDKPLGNNKNAIALKYKDSLGIVRKTWFIWNCLRCGKDFIPTKSPSGISHMFKQRAINGQSPCPWCGSAPVGNNKLRSVEDDLYKLYPLFTERNYYPSWLNGKELDLYDPESKVAIEYDGVLYHSSKYKREATYHYDKTVLSEEHNVNLIHIFETDWTLHRDCVLHVIDASLGKLETILSDHCTYKCIQDNNLVNTFLIENHIKGSAKFDIAIGIFYDNRLSGVCCMQKVGTTTWHLTRYSTRLHIDIEDGLGNAIKQFLKFQPGVTSITATAECMYGNWYSSMLMSAGFHAISKSGPNRWFTDLCANHELLKELPSNTDATEFYEIYDSGTKEYCFDVPN